MIEGVSQEITYNDGGGIALYAAQEPPSGALSGSGNEGDQTQITRIRWWIMKDSSSQTGYRGGITGADWYIGETNSPFPAGTTEEAIYNAAQDRNLNEYFGPWNDAHQSDGYHYAFIVKLFEDGNGDCVIGDIGS